MNLMPRVQRKKSKNLLSREHQGNIKYVDLENHIYSVVAKIIPLSLNNVF